MRLKLVKIFAVLLIAGHGDARPQQFEVAASLSPEVEDSDGAGGWRPIIRGENVPQKQISLGKEDLPQIIEGNSRYNAATRRKSYYVKNKLFYEDHVVSGSHNTGNGNHEGLGLDVSGTENNLRHNIRKEVNEGLVNIAGESNVDRVKLLLDSLLSENQNLPNVKQFSAARSNHTGLEKASERFRAVLVPPSRKKVRNFIRLVPAYSRAKISAEKPVYFTDDLHDTYDRVSDANSYQFESNSEKLAPSFQRPVDGASDGQRLGSDNSREIWLKIKPPNVNESSPQSNLKINNNNKHNNSLKKNPRPKGNSSQIIPELNLKNWPNDNLQNVEDLINYEKYTSFHGGVEDSEIGEVSDSLGLQQNKAPGINHQIKKRPSNKPSVMILEQALPLEYPGSQSNQEESSQGATQWEQIPSFDANNSDFPISDTVENSETDFGLILDDLQPNRPLSIENESNGQLSSTDYHGNIKGENSVPLVVENNAYVANQGQQYYEDHNQGFVFNEPNYGESARPTSETNVDDGNNPTSLVSQNTVVHILNVGQKRPNVTVTGMKVPYQPGMPLTVEDPKTEQKNSSTGSPNVHIMFTVQEIKDEEGVDRQELAMSQQQQQIPEVSYDDDGINCPTVTIHSYTRINNTIEGKDGCTDLNIVINSHVLNTNVYRPSPDSTNLPSERYPEGQGENPAGYAPAEGVYGGGYPAQDEFQNIPGNSGQNFLSGFTGGQGAQFGQQIPSISTYEVFQQTQINVGSQNDASANADNFDPGVSNDPPSPGDGFEDIPSSPDIGAPDIPSTPDAVPGTGVINDPVSLTEVADDPIDAGIPGAPSLDAGIPGAPSLGGIQSPLADAGPADVLADVGSQNIAADAPLAPASGGSSGIGFPSLGNPLSGIPGQLSDAVGNLGGIGGSDSNGGIGSPGSILGGGDGNDDDDGDDDEMFELMPFSIMESVTSMLPYFTFLNPLNYGFLSIAISPLAVATVGLFGLAAAFVPWVFPNALDFGRAANRVDVRLKPNLEDVVKQSIHKYRNWNDWKSKRKKRKR